MRLSCIPMWHGGVRIMSPINYVQLRPSSLHHPLLDISDMTTNGVSNTSVVPTNDDSTKPPGSPQPGVDASPTFPDPKTSPTAFLGYLRSLATKDLVSPWEHLQAAPARSGPDNRYVQDEISAWTDHMDVLLVSGLTIL